MPCSASGTDSDRIVHELAASALVALSSSLCVLDDRGGIVLVNTAWRGFAVEAGAVPVREGVNYLEVCERSAAAGDADAARFAAGLRRVLSGAEPRFFLECPCETPQGVRWFVVRAGAFQARGRRWVLVVHDDITDLKLTEAALAHANTELERRAVERAEALRLAEQRYEIVARASHDGLFDWTAGGGDGDGGDAYFSQRFLDLLGPGVRHGGPPAGAAWWRDRLHPDDADRVEAVLRLPLARGGPFAVECRLRRDDGTHIWGDLRGYAVFDAARGTVSRVVGTLTDSSCQKKAEAALLAGATQDGLTGLPNRALFLDRLSLALQDARGTPPGDFALMLVDLDHFGVLNRHCGSDVGDAVLQEVARRIAETAPPNSVARVGGDEFGVLLPHQEDTRTAEALAAGIGRAFAAPFPAEDARYRLSASIGIVHSSALAPQDGAGAALADADLAMLAARERGGARWEVFQPGHRARATRSFEMADALREAVGDGRAPKGFALAYQPVVDLATGRIAGFEALMRWTHPVLGSVSPVDFIPAAENLGLIIPLGLWAVRQGCALLAGWRRRMAPDRVPFISVNVSARQLYEPGFEDMILGALAETGAPAAALKLEVTESAILDNALRAAGVLSALQGEGIRIAIDDFGTGFSCLGYLSRFRFDGLKIDASFVRDMTSNERAMAVVKTIVALGRGLDMSIIAEGAERLDEVKALGRIGCPLVQGYYFGRPRPVGDAEQLLKQGIANWSPALAT